MTEAVRSNAPRPNVHDLSLVWPATPTDVYDALGRLARRASAPIGTVPGDLRVIGAPSLAELAPTVRPIGAALVLGGFDPAVAGDLQRALAPAASLAQTSHPAPIRPLAARCGPAIRSASVSSAATSSREPRAR